VSAPDRTSIRVGVVDEHEIFRRGIVSCLEAEPGIAVVVDAAEVLPERSLDVVVASPQAASGEPFGCPVLLCTSRGAPRSRGLPHAVKGVLPRATLTTGQLVAAVRAAAAGLAVRIDDEGASTRLDARSLDVLRLLAEGADTQQVADVLECSSRTVKTLISGIERALDARNRAHAVAVGIRDGLI
jgi:DNA-binding NarL/FixJ family response regulator